MEVGFAVLEDGGDGGDGVVDEHAFGRRRRVWGILLFWGRERMAFLVIGRSELTVVGAVWIFFEGGGTGSCRVVRWACAGRWVVMRDVAWQLVVVVVAVFFLTVTCGCVLKRREREWRICGLLMECGVGSN